MRYSQFAANTPQDRPIPGKGMVKNNAGGYGFQVDKWTYLHRFLILGSEGGSYYVSERDLTLKATDNVLACIAEDGRRVVREVCDVSCNGLAPKNDPALFVLALCVANGDAETKKAALDNLGRVARTGTHLFHFAQYIHDLSGKWNRSLRRAVANWYDTEERSRLAYQVVKYRQRDGWTHADLLRLSHPSSAINQDIYRWIMAGLDGMDKQRAIVRGVGRISYYDPLPQDTLPSLIVGYEAACRAQTEGEILSIIREYGLPWEAIDSKWLGSRDVWATLLETGCLPLEAITRNLGRMTANGVLGPLSEHTRMVTDRLGQEDYVRRSHLHPLKILVAMRMYAQGHGDKGSLTWNPVAPILDALDGAFYAAFGNVQPTGKNIMLALDVSGSMTWRQIAGLPITPREASAALALITANVEPNCLLTAFATRMELLTISPRQRLDDVIRTIEKMDAGGTDCALPMLYAQGMNRKDYMSHDYSQEGYGLDVDAFVILTDNESWAGRIHPTQALAAYRRKSGRVANAYLFKGPEGSPKEELALRFAKGLLCDSDEPRLFGRQCDSCWSCRVVSNHGHPDLFEMEREGMTIKIKASHEMLKEAMARPYHSARKVFLVKNAEDMTVEAANALLKVLEEPPQYVTFILTVTNVGSILDTIVSRCQVVPVRKMPSEALVEILVRGHGVTSEVATDVAQYADGSLQLALRILSRRSEGAGEQLLAEVGKSSPIELAQRYARAEPSRRVDVLTDVEIELVRRLRAETTGREMRRLHRSLTSLRKAEERLKSSINPFLTFSVLFMDLSRMRQEGE